jgi:hypothetical protein
VCLHSKGFEGRSFSLETSPVRKLNFQDNMRIQSLLNPCGNQDSKDRMSSSVTPPPAQTFPATRDITVPKRQKIAKDAMILTAGSKVNGNINYPPYEANGDPMLVREHQKCHIHPAGNIADYRRHIPYTSDKKEFTERTGRQAFEGMLKLRDATLSD